MPRRTDRPAAADALLATLYDQTPGEEVANALTHALGVVLSLAGLVVLVGLAGREGGGLAVASLAVYGLSLVLTYLASTLHHATRGVRAKLFWLWLDHVAIFLLIAGTYTPVALLGLGGARGWGLFAAVWALAAFGIVFRLAYRGHGRFVLVSLYVAMGWLGMVALAELQANLGPGGVFWIVVGGAVYTAGIAFYVLDRMPYNHAVWHLFVLAGSACHFTGILLHVAPRAALLG